MAVVKPLKLTVNFEGAWKEFRREYSHKYIHGILKKRSTADTHLIVNLMDDLENSYKNVITIGRRTGEEMVDYCIKKSVEARMENIHLKKELREQKKRMIFRNVGYSKFIETRKKPERKLFKVNLITITDDSLEFNLNMKVTAKKFEYYKNAYNKGENISWHGLKMRIVELNISISPPGVDRGKDKISFEKDTFHE